MSESEAGYKMMLRVPIPYDPSWPVLFDQLKTELCHSTGLTSIFHIGSTAVPGLAAKPIIDMQLGVTSLETFETSFLKQAGFDLAPEITRDDPPPGHDQTPGKWRKLYARRHENGVRIAQLHIRQFDLPNFRAALLMRDFLRANSNAATQYGTFKNRVANASRDISEPGGTGAYLDLKDPFVALLIMMSEDWAARTDWTVPKA